MFLLQSPISIGRGSELINPTLLAKSQEWMLASHHINRSTAIYHQTILEMGMCSYRAVLSRPSLLFDRLMRDTGYRIEPFMASEIGVRGSGLAPGVSPDDSETGYDNTSQLRDGTRSPTGRLHRGHNNSSVTIPTLSPPPSSDLLSSRQSQAIGSQQVYVVHHDGGRAPVTVYTSEGAQVVELPPRYPEEGTSPRQGESPSATDATSSGGDGSASGRRHGVRPLPRPLEQARQAGPTPTKGRNPKVPSSS